MLAQPVLRHVVVRVIESYTRTEKYFDFLPRMVLRAIFPYRIANAPRFRCGSLVTRES